MVKLIGWVTSRRLRKHTAGVSGCDWRCDLEECLTPIPSSLTSFPALCFPVPRADQFYPTPLSHYGKNQLTWATVYISFFKLFCLHFVAAAEDLTSAVLPQVSLTAHLLPYDGVFLTTTGIILPQCLTMSVLYSNMLGFPTNILSAPSGMPPCIWPSFLRVSDSGDFSVFPGFDDIDSFEETKGTVLVSYQIVLLLSLWLDRSCGCLRKDNRKELPFLFHRIRGTFCHRALSLSSGFCVFT